MTTPAKVIRRVTGDIAHLLTPRARRWIVGWLVGAMARGMPLSRVYSLCVMSGRFASDAVYLEWDLNDGARAILECGPDGERYWWCSPDIWEREGDGHHDATVKLDGPTTARIVTLLRWMERT